MDIDTELSDLLNTVAEADRPAMREMLTRNPSAATMLTSRETVYKAFVDGDPVKLAAATALANPANPNPANPNPANPNSPANQPIGLCLYQINTLLDAKVNAIYTSPQFGTAVETRAKEIAKTMFEAERANIIGRSAEISAE